MPIRLNVFISVSLLLLILAVPNAFSQESDVFVQKSGPEIAAAGTDVSYEVVVTNAGPDAAAAIQLTDPIPSGMTFVSASPAGCSTAVIEMQETIICTIPSLAATESVTFTFVLHIPEETPAGTTFTNIAAASTATDSTDENNSGVAVTSTPPPPLADMGVTKNGPAAGGPDTNVTFTILVTNGGPDAAVNVEITDTLPGNMTFVSLDDGGLACSTPEMATGGTIVCTAESFPASTSVTLTLVAHVPADTLSGTFYQNTVTVSSDNDTNSENDEASTGFTVTSVDIAVAKQGTPNVDAGQEATYTITVSNAGPDIASVVLIDAVPEGATFVSLTQDTGPSASCSVPAGGSSSGEVTCQMMLGMDVTAQFTLVLRAGNTTLITNTAIVGAGEFDEDTTNNTATAETTVNPRADLSVVKSGPSAVTAGTEATYSITVTNDGPSDAASVTLTDALPAELTLVSLTQTEGNPTFDCSGATCTATTMAPGQTATFSLVAHLLSSTPSGTSVTNSASAASSTVDPDSEDNDSSTTATSASSADVSVTKNGPSGVSSGSNLTYAITLANAGPSDAATVSFTDDVPPNTTFVSAVQDSGPTFTCALPDQGATGTITCTISSLAAGASAALQLVFSVDSDASDSITNTGDVSSQTVDPNDDNNADSATTLVNPPTDVRITKTATQDRDTATFTIVVTNIGDVEAVNTVVTDTLPGNTTFISAETTQGTCSGTSTVTCSVGTLLPEGSAMITIVVALPSTPFETVSNTATVTMANEDTNTGNDSSTVAFQVDVEVPALSPIALMLLAVSIAAVAIVVLR